MTNDFVGMMKRLAACRVTPEEWAAWWAENEASAQTLLSRGQWLRLKPCQHGFRWVPALTSQKEAIAYLEKNGMAFERNDDYQKNYEKELEDYSQASREKEKVALDALRERLPALFSAYPRFCRSLAAAFSAGDRIEPGVPDEAVSSAPCPLPADIAAFFKTVSVISLDSISIDFSALRTEHLCGKEYLVLGEFWKEADGDLLLIKPDSLTPTTIYYYSHGIDKVKKLCDSIYDLLEKQFSGFNQQ